MSDYLIQSDAPLAETDLTQVQGLTLEDLARMHGDDTSSLEVSSEATPADASQEEDSSESGQAPWQEETQSVDRRLRQALILSLGQEEVHLDQKDDLRQITAQAVELFQETLPDTMQRLGQFLHAREQTEHLYDRLTELSNNRGAASEIIQTAKQIEALEKVQQQDQIDQQELNRLDQQLAQMKRVVSRYREICALAMELS